MNYSEYKEQLAGNRDFWEIEGIDGICEFLKDRNLNYFMYRTGEAIAAHVLDQARPVITVELHPQVEKMRVMKYYATYQLFNIQVMTGQYEQTN